MTEPSDKALDKAAEDAGYANWSGAQREADELASIRAHARTLDELEAAKAGLEAVRAELAALKGEPDPYALGLREVLARWHGDELTGVRKGEWDDHTDFRAALAELRARFVPRDDA